MGGDYSLDQLLHSEVGWLTILALGLTALLLRFRPHERAVYLNTLWLFLIGVFGQALAFVFDALAFPTAASVLHTIFRIVAAIAAIRLLGFAVFRLVLPMFELFHISCTGVETKRGRLCPPHSASNGSAFHPPSQNFLYASRKPFGVRTSPSAHLEPSWSPE